MSNKQTRERQDMEVSGRRREDILCGPCKEEGKQNPIMQFCKDCQDFICKECVANHKKYKQLKKHTSITVESTNDVNSIRECFDEALHTCQTHEAKEVEYYCKTHNSFCCSSCVITLHKLCENITDVKELKTDAETTLVDTKKKLQQSEKHLEDMIKVKKAHIEQIPENEKALHSQIEQYEAQVIAAIKTRFEETTRAAVQASRNTKEKTHSEIEQLMSTKNRCQKHFLNIDTVLKFGPPSQLVASSHHERSDYYKTETEILKMDKEYAYEQDIVVENPEIFSKVFETLKKLDINVGYVSKPSPFDPFEKTINGLKHGTVVKKTKAEVRLVSECSTSFTSIDLLDDNTLVLADSCNQSDACGHIAIYNIQTKRKVKLKLDKPSRLTVLRNTDSQMAAIVPLEKKLYILSLETNQLVVKHSFVLQKTPVALSSMENGHVVIAFPEPKSIIIVHVASNELKVIKSINLATHDIQIEPCLYIAVNERRGYIVCVCDATDAIYSFDFSGNQVFKFSHGDLESPRGVACDRDSNIYICSHSYTKGGQVFVLDSYGELLKVITLGVPDFPTAITFDRSGTSFWVTSLWDKFDEVFQFQIQETKNF